MIKQKFKKTTLQLHETYIENYITVMKTFMSEFSNENAEEKNKFMMYTKYQKGDVVPEIFLYLPPPGSIRLTKSDPRKNNILKDTMGSIVSSTDHLSFLDSSEVELIRIISIDDRAISSLCYQQCNVDTENKHDKRGGIFRYNMDRHRLQEIAYKETWEPFFNKKHIKAYMSENINGDICISTDSVEVFTAGGQKRFSYRGVSGLTFRSFSPSGICTDVLGNILIADENNNVIHILDQNGEFLALMPIHK
ncbi:uncharacterized protein LOC134240898 [Saccostrea cucullata]|uniref:uncharacterized protein LOC134240898 n=1 Tax=Saccostrea cuccullata TaxID=36930 RepID=UPI002ED155A7